MESLEWYVNGVLILQVDSVRYGIIGCYITKRNISKGEEILSDYGPKFAKLCERDPIQSWYYDLWQNFKEDNPDKNQKIDLYETIAKRKIWKLWSHSKSINLLNNLPKKLHCTINNVKVHLLLPIAFCQSFPNCSI